MNWQEPGFHPYPHQTEAVTPEGNGSIDVSPGNYRVLVREVLPSADLYIKEATLNGVDVLNGSCRTTGPVNGALKVVFSNRGGRIEGTLVDAQLEPLPGREVVLIPDWSRHRDELFKDVETDQNGRFQFTGITPGGYRLFAWEALEPHSYFDPEVLARYEHRGTPVRVRESSSESVRLEIIPAALSQV